MKRRHLCIFSIFALFVYRAYAANDDVRVPPRLLVTPPNEIIFKQYLATELPCEASGVPQPVEYEWFKDGSSLNLNDPNIQRSTDPALGTITITPTDSRYDGYYRCSAKNTWGRAISDVTHALLAMMAPLPSANPIRTTATESTPLRLPCTQTKSAPNVTYAWGTSSYVDDPLTTFIQLDRRISMSDTGDLYFAYVIPNDNQQNRIYKCVLKNPELDITMGGSYTTLQVNANPVDTVAVTLKYSSAPTLTAIKGRPFYFRCIFSGKASPSITWSRASGNWDTSRYEQKDYDTRLVIKDVVEADQDTYTCKGSNSVNDISKEMQLQVKVVPEFQNVGDYPQDLNATEGTTITIACRTYANPAASVKWFINGDPLQPNQKRQLSADGITLTLANLCRDNCGAAADLMVVSCNASNAYGYAYASGFVNVLQQTVLTPGLPASVELAIPNPTDLVCKGTSDPGTVVAINWFLNGYLITNESGKYEVYKNPSSTTLRILTQGTPKVSGTYMCLITNGYSAANQTVAIAYPKDVVESASFPFWIVAVVLVALLFILIIVFLCYQCIKRNKGDVYQVDKSERKNGNSPEDELANDGYHDYQRQEDDGTAPVLKSSRGSWGSKATLSNEPFVRGTASDWDENA